MTSSHGWRAESKCQRLSPQQSDSLFFTGRGGKVNKAEAFCNSCPVVGLCLNYAIENDLEGFWAGTTQNERRAMAPFKNIRIKSDALLIPEPSKKRRVLRKIISPPDVHEWLDKVEGPVEEELQSA